MEMSNEVPDWVADLDEAFELILKHRDKLYDYWLKHAEEGFISCTVKKIEKGLKDWGLIEDA